MDDEIFLTGNFQQYPECNNTYNVRLGRKNLIFEQAVDSVTYTKLTDGFTSVLLQDVVAARLYNSKIPNDTSAYFHITAYPLTKVGKMRRKRKKKEFTFRVSESDDEESNMIVAETWARSVEWLIKNPSISQEDLQSKDTFPKKRRILVLINPKSGNGASVSKFRKFVEPVFKDAGIYYQEFVTKCANQAIEVSYSLHLSDWEGIAICSGDGLAYEVVQGFMQRDDWEKAIKMPIGMIPTGSGNALCASVLYHAKDVFDITSASFHVVRGIPVPIDLCAMQNDKQRFFSFLSLTWGIISDIDIESERLRLLGNARFTAGAVSRILALRIYSGKLAYLPISESELTDEKCENSETRDPDSSYESCVTETQFQTDETSNRKLVFKDALDYERLEENTREEDYGDNIGFQNSRQRGFSSFDVKVRNQNSMRKVASTNVSAGKYEPMLETDEDISTDDKDIKRSFQKRAFSTTDMNRSVGKEKESSLNKSKQENRRQAKGPVDSALPPLDIDLPEEWVTLDDEFVTVMILLVSHLGSSLISCPGLKLGDGQMWLMFIKKGISRKSLVDFLTKMETGEHVSNNDVEIRKIKAFRLEPKFNRKGYIAVDGEVVEYERIQGQIHRGLGRVFACA